MTAFTGPVTINNIGGASIVEFGDTVFISPKAASKTTHGAKLSNTAVQKPRLVELVSQIQYKPT